MLSDRDNGGGGGGGSYNPLRVRSVSDRALLASSENKTHPTQPPASDITINGVSVGGGGGGVATVYHNSQSRQSVLSSQGGSSTRTPSRLCRVSTNAECNESGKYMDIYPCVYPCVLTRRSPSRPLLGYYYYY